MTNPVFIGINQRGFLEITSENTNSFQILGELNYTNASAIAKFALRSLIDALNRATDTIKNKRNAQDLMDSACLLLSCYNTESAILPIATAQKIRSYLEPYPQALSTRKRSYDEMSIGYRPCGTIHDHEGKFTNQESENELDW